MVLMKRFAKVFLSVAVCFTLCSPASAKDKPADTWISKTAQKACVNYGNEYCICPELLMAIIETESSGDPKAKNGTCTGLMQVSSRWHADRMKRLGVKSLYDERGNVHVGTDYMSELILEHGDVATALMIYHGESDALSKADCGIISGYASKILRRSAELERLHGK